MDVGATGNISTATQSAQAIQATQQTPVAKEAEVNASSALQQYQQQQQQSSSLSKVQDPVQIRSAADVSKNLNTLRSIEQMHNQRSELIKSVRETNEELDRAVQTIDQMQNTLSTVVKNFPPYNTENLERKELLMSYLSLRKEIESLMVPPPPPPVWQQVQSLWKEIFAENGQLSPTAVAALETSAGGKQVQMAMEDLTTLSNNLGNLSNSLTQALIGS